MTARRPRRTTGTDPVGDTDDAPTVERRSPEVTFGLLGDDTRVAILRALGETPDEAVPFARLRERVGARDSGGFNYHLGKLVGSFVRKTDAGYELTHAGRGIVGAMYAGTYTANATVDPIAVDGECPLCGGDLVASYAEETARTSCTGCDDWYNEFAFPPGSLDQFDRAELPYAFDRWMRHVFGGVLAGFCPTCGGRMDGRLVIDEASDRHGGMPAHAEFACRRCGGTARSSAGLPAMLHPGVQGFLFDHGFDPRRDPSWEISATVDRHDLRILAEEPPRVEVGFTYDGETVTAVVEADATVDGVERRPAED